MIPMNMPNGPAAYVGLEVGARAGVHTTVSACASGSEAIAHGLDLIQLDRADVVVVGGTEACIHPLNIAGFAQMRAMSTRNDEPQRASRPFDKNRDGFVLGEGAGMLGARAGVIGAGTRATARTPGWPVRASPPTPTTSSRPTRPAAVSAAPPRPRSIARAWPRATSCT